VPSAASFWIIVVKLSSNSLDIYCGLIKPVNGWPVVPIGLGTSNIIWLPALGFILYIQKWSNIEPLGTGGTTFKAKLPLVVVVVSYIVCTLLGSYSNLIKSPDSGVNGKVISLNPKAIEVGGVTWEYWFWFNPVNPNDAVNTVKSLEDEVYVPIVQYGLVIKLLAIYVWVLVNKVLASLSVANILS